MLVLIYALFYQVKVSDAESYSLQIKLYRDESFVRFCISLYRLAYSIFRHIDRIKHIKL